MAQSFYQALDGAPVRRGEQTWFVHVARMDHVQQSWSIQLALLGGPSFTVTLKLLRLDAEDVPSIVARIEEWLRSPAAADYDVIVIDTAAPSAPSPDGLPATIDDPAARRPVVLLVDDVVDHLRLYELTLNDRYTILNASRGDEGYRIACAAKPDVIVLDVMMPDMDGWTLCERLKANPGTAACPVIMMTGSAAPDLTARAKRAGAVALLHKPYVIDVLERTIDEALGRKDHLL
jgi:CheY-like chemotaxis protein